MKFHPFSASAWTAVVSVLLAGSSSASDHDGGFVSLPLAGRSRSPLSLGEAWARVAQVKLKQYRAIQNFKANTGDYPADVNLTTLQRLTDGISPTAAIHKATMKIEMAGLAGKRADVATIELEDQKQASFWTGPQSYGSPKQGPFVLDHDTGSADTIVNENSGYRPQQSKTAQRTGRSFRIGYGDGTMATGPVYKDDFYIGNVKARDVAIGVANGSTLGLGEKTAGISGMSFASISSFKEEPFFISLVKQKAVPADVFAFGLQREGGRLDLGGIERKAYKGDLKYVDVNKGNGFWQVQGSIQGMPLGRAIIDTGTTALILPMSLFVPVCLQIGGFVVPNGSSAICAVTGKVPDNLTLAFGGTTYKVAPETLFLGEENGRKYLGLFGQWDFVLSTGAIIGDTFLRNVYAVFEGSTGNNPRIGFAPTTQKP